MRCAHAVEWAGKRESTRRQQQQQTRTPSASNRSANSSSSRRAMPASVALLRSRSEMRSSPASCRSVVDAPSGCCPGAMEIERSSSFARAPSTPPGMATCDKATDYLSCLV